MPGNNIHKLEFLVGKRERFFLRNAFSNILVHAPVFYMTAIRVHDDGVVDDNIPNIAIPPDNPVFDLAAFMGIFRNRNVPDRFCDPLDIIRVNELTGVNVCRHEVPAFAVSGRTV